MTPEQQQRVNALFDELSEQPRERWKAALAAEPDQEVATEVRRLLEAMAELPSHADADGLAEKLLMAPGSEIGPYRVLGTLGEGGFGLVYEAERREPHIQRVALKVIKPGMDTKAVLTRFEQERQALAIMDHPNLAKVFDAGSTDDGRPYFVMELVRGEPITDYCDRQKLDTTRRLELFCQACEAIEHAHTKGIVHRDVKPSNVLVSEHDGKPVVKVIDFGVAKAVSHTFAARTVFTEQGQLIGTPEYMSPEQAEMGAIDVDTRTDVYGLGVLLYELVSGTLPFDPKTLRAAGFDEIRRIIREDDPPRPSTKLSSLGDEASEIADRRRAAIRELTNQLQSELEWIPLKALRKNRAERYRSPIHLADDVRRYLKGEALEAGPESTAYRLRKLVRRHRAAFAMTTLIAAVLIMATLVSVRFGIGEAAARQRSDEMVRLLASVVATSLAESELLWRHGRPEEAFQWHEQLAADLQASSLAKDPVTFDVLEAIANAYKHYVHNERDDTLGLLDQADRYYDVVWRGRRSTLGPSNPTTIGAQYNAVLVDLIRVRLLDDEAEKLALRITALSELRGLAEQLESVSVDDEGLQWVIAAEIAKLLRRVEGAEAAKTKYEEVIAAMRAERPSGDWRTAEVIANSAFVYQDLGDYATAAARLEEALPIYRQERGPTHPDSIAVTNMLAGLREQLGTPARAIELLTHLYRDLDEAARREVPEKARAAEAALAIAAAYERLGDGAASERWRGRAGAPTGL